MALQNGKTVKTLHGHIIISGVIHCKTGLHIGGSSETIEIGGIDKPIMRNPLTNEPYIPGSSLKGKLRSIVEIINSKPSNRHGGDKDNKIWRHECEGFLQAKDCVVCRIFGATGKVKDNDNFTGALLVRDANLHNKSKLERDGLPVIEAKMENALDRLTSAATPRTFERVPAGAEFSFELVYKVESIDLEGKVQTVDTNKTNEDIRNLLNAMEILEKDGLGGNISRGYGRVEFIINEFKATDIYGKEKGKIEKMKIAECKNEIEKLEFCKK